MLNDQIVPFSSNSQHGLKDEGREEVKEMQANG